MCRYFGDERNWACPNADDTSTNNDISSTHVHGCAPSADDTSANDTSSTHVHGCAHFGPAVWELHSESRLRQEPLVQ